MLRILSMTALGYFGAIFLTFPTRLGLNTVQKDEKKQAAIESIGFTVLRFTDDEVLNQINRVLAKIEEYIDEFEAGKKVG